MRRRIPSVTTTTSRLILLSIIALYVVVFFLGASFRTLALVEEEMIQRVLLQEAAMNEFTATMRLLPNVSTLAVMTKPNAIANASLRADYIELGADRLWNAILALPKAPGAVALEVGMHSAQQAKQAARVGLIVHGIEPSPTSFRRAQRKIRHTPNIYLHNVAASAHSGDLVPFTASGGTGDHVGNVNMWEMKVGQDIRGEVIHVKTQTLDDLIRQEIQPNQVIHVLKVDTQGFEMSVFEGLQETLKQQRIQYILTEFWPKGMDLLSNNNTAKCDAGVKVLNMLATAGYTLYAMALVNHRRGNGVDFTKLPPRPLDDFMQHCLWYYQVDEHAPVGYNMGYWSDIAAVAPGAQPLPPLL